MLDSVTVSSPSPVSMVRPSSALLTIMVSSDPAGEITLMVSKLETVSVRPPVNEYVPPLTV